MYKTIAPKYHQHQRFNIHFNCGARVRTSRK